PPEEPGPAHPELKSRPNKEGRSHRKATSHSPRIRKAKAKPNPRQERLRHEGESFPKGCPLRNRCGKPNTAEETFQRESQHSGREAPDRKRTAPATSRCHGQGGTKRGGNQS